MKKYTAQEVRQKFLDFMLSKGHALIPSASLVPENDPTSLFVNSGMQPLIPYLMGEKHPQGVRLANSQKCLRMEDVEEVGDGRHTTYFEMLGNWSLGDPENYNGIGAGYFKEEQLAWWFEFLVSELGLDIGRLYSTVFEGDENAPKDENSISILKDVYKKHDLDAREGNWKKDVPSGSARIFAYGADKNWWKRGDAIGELGGPDSEVFYDTGRAHDEKFGERCHLNCDCGRFIEIGNSVFMQYKKTETGWEELSQKNVDFGGGLERVTTAVQGRDRIFETELFSPVITKLELLSGRKYGDAGKHDKAFEVVADHLRAATFVIGDDKGVVPSNVDQGYIARRLLRRAIRQGKMLGISENFTREIASVYINDYKNIFEELERNREFILNEMEKEEAKFKKTLEKALENAEDVFARRPKEDGSFMTHEESQSDTLGKKAFELFQQDGLPPEDTFDLWRNKGIEFSKKEVRLVFDAEFKKHQEKSRTASAGKFKGGLADAGEETKKLHTATHLLHAALRKVLGEHVFQKGSNITTERLRFDFSHSEKLTEEQKKEVENLINKQIQEDLPVTVAEMSPEEAKKLDAIGVFEAKYGDRVKVYTVGDNNNVFSREICGGPHVAHTGELGHFQIKKEEASSAGVRRIKAVLE